MSASLPHTYPFRLIDTVLEGPPTLTQGPTASEIPPLQGTVLARVSANSRVVGGEQAWASPQLLAEAIAQAALLVGRDDSEMGRRGFLAGIDGFEVARLPRAGETLSISVRLFARFGAVVKFDGEIRCGEEIIARGSVLVKEGREDRS